VIIKATKRIFNSDKICRSYCDFYFGVTFLEHTVVVITLTTTLHDVSVIFALLHKRRNLQIDK